MTSWRISSISSSVGGRIEVQYVLPDEDRDTLHCRYLDNDDEVTSVELHNKAGEWY